MRSIALNLLGAGVYGPGFTTMEELRVDDAIPDEFVPPKPQRIPPRERRRAPLLVKLAVEVADQACTAAGIEPGKLPSVFASALGDTDIIDNMCRAVANDPALLSPTRFHNSVHNAAAGYWSISTEGTEPANSLSSLGYTASTGLLEAGMICEQENRPVLLVVFDRTTPAPMRFQEIRDSFAAALVLGPAQNGDASLELSVTDEPGDWPLLAAPNLQELYQNNPAARILPLILGESLPMRMPLSTQRTLILR